jgi:hypothetical protein
MPRLHLPLEWQSVTLAYGLILDRQPSPEGLGNIPKMIRAPQARHSPDRPLSLCHPVHQTCLRQVEGAMNIAKVDYGECRCRKRIVVPTGVET